MVKRLIYGTYHLAIRIPGLRQVLQLLRNVYRWLIGKPQLVHFDQRVYLALPRMADRNDYDRLTALNAVDAVASVTTEMYARLGIAPENAPILPLLQRARAELAAEVDLDRARRQGSALVRFEAAWTLYQAGETAAALEAFEALVADDALLRNAQRNIYCREALIRSAEILGRRAERAGDVATAMRLYERIMTAGGRGVIARRLTELLWRQGRIREAAALAERAIWSDHNLASQAAKDNAHLTRAAEVLARAGAAPQPRNG